MPVIKHENEQHDERCASGYHNISGAGSHANGRGHPDAGGGGEPHDMIGMVQNHPSANEAHANDYL